MKYCFLGSKGKTDVYCIPVDEKYTDEEIKHCLAKDESLAFYGVLKGELDEKTLVAILINSANSEIDEVQRFVGVMGLGTLTEVAARMLKESREKGATKDESKN